VVTNIYLIQLVGVVLATAGMIALTASARLFGTPSSPAEKKRASDDWNRRRDAHRLPINLETVASTIFFLGGIGILAWSKFEPCAFLAYWLPSMPSVIRLFLSCK